MDVSVIIPTYNRLWCLPIAIDSCRNSKCKTEIIVVDDGSKDGTWDWLVSQRDIVSIYQPNQGQTYAINKGTSVAKGKYVRFLDSDDFLETGIIDKQFELAESTNADIVVSNVSDYDFEEKKVIKENKDPLFWDDFLERQLSPQYGSHFLAMLFHRKLVEAVPRRPDFALREDRMFLLEVAILNPKVEYLPVNAGFWVKHSSQMQANYQGLKSVVTNWQHLSIYKKIAGILEEKGMLTEARKVAISNSVWPIAHWIGKTHVKEAIEVYKWIKELNPNFIIPEKGGIGLLYKKLGFANTEKVLTIRRKLKFGLWS